MTSPSSPPHTVAFVLGGGGTKGSFEVGALQYVVGVERMLPDVITATSAGAIAASVLAQARTREEFDQRVGEIERDVLALTRTEHVFGEQAWLQALRGTALGDAIQFALTEGTRPPVPPLEATAPDPAVAPRSERARRKARRARRRQVVLMFAGAAPRLPRARRGLRHSGSSALNLDPLAGALRHGGPSDIGPIDPGLIGRPGLALRLAVTALQAGVLRYVTESGTIVEDDAHTPVAGAGAGPIDLVDGVLASASVPLVFPPRSLADDEYVDGGVLQVIPVAAAVKLGASRIVAIAAMPLRLDRDDRNFADGPAVHIGIRAVGMIGLSDRQRENLATPLPAGTTLHTIDPVVDVVGLFEVQPGLLRINKEYGWLRAADVFAPGDPTLLEENAARTHQLVTARVRAWHLEEDLWGMSRTEVADAGTLAQLRDLKETVYSLVDQRKQLGFPVPDDCASWWDEYEVHAGPRPVRLPACPSIRR